MNAATPAFPVSRRAFLTTGAGAALAALVIGIRFRETGAAGAPPAEGSSSTPVSPFDAWLRLAADGTVTLTVAKSEMGQGVFTSLPMILAEELDVDWARVQIVQALARPRVYDHGTGGSGSIAGSWLPLRQAGAAARAMLIAAAAQTWRVDPAACRTDRGVVLHEASGRREPYGALVDAASKLPIPDATSLTLKSPDAFHIVGTSPLRRDLPDKVTGAARFGIDTRVPGMLFAVIARCPVLGGKARRVDASKARAVRGVRDVFEIPAMPDNRIHTLGGVAIVAETTWAALEGRKALAVEWDEGPNAEMNSAALRAQFASILAKDGEGASIVRDDGDARQAIASAARRIEATYELPFQPHAPMEPMNCTVHVRDDGAEAWVGTQSGGQAQDVVSKLADLPADKVVVHTTMMGGSFGRRFSKDFVAEATQISQRTKAPIQVVWTREDDIAHDFYRPASFHKLTAGFDARRRPTAWRYQMTSTALDTFWAAPGNRHPERGETGGAADAPYALPAFRLEYTPAVWPLKVQWWRSVEHSVTAFAVECFIDEMAHAAGEDPLAFRLRLLADARPWKAPWSDRPPTFNPARLRDVLKLAAEKAGWRTPAPAGRARGIAGVYSFNTYVAEVAEVSVVRGVPRVHRVTCAVDCGEVVHPDGVAAQMEGAIVYGLSATLNGAITIDRGRAQQQNFDTFSVMRIQDAPLVDVHITPSHEAPSGTGEPGLPPIAPAVANALFALTGTRVRRLPIDRLTS